MKSLPRVICACVALALLSVMPANAQVASPATEMVFVNVNFGAQLAERSLTTIATTPVYEEVATVASEQTVSGGATFDVSAGYRVWGDVYAALLVSVFGSSCIPAFSPHWAISAPVTLPAP